MRLILWDDVNQRTISLNNVLQAMPSPGNKGIMVYYANTSSELFKDCHVYAVIG